MKEERVELDEPLLTDEERDEARKEVVAALDELGKSQGEVPLIRPDVDEAMVATVVAAWTGIPVGKMVQDDVKATSRLTLNLGLRYEFNTTHQEAHGNYASFRQLMTDTD